MYQRDTDWTSKLTPFGVFALETLGYYEIPANYNPVTRALAEDPERWVAKWQTHPDFSKAEMSRLVVACQMPLYDRERGPDGDGKPKGLRRHWYHYYKTRFAQPFGLAIGDVTNASKLTTDFVASDHVLTVAASGDFEPGSRYFKVISASNIDHAVVVKRDMEPVRRGREIQIHIDPPTQPLDFEKGAVVVPCDQTGNLTGMIDDRRWSQLISITYGEYVDKLDVIYLDLWVKDASRMIKSFYDQLFYRSNIVLAVEKDSLFDDFLEPAERLGVKVVYSGKGKSSKAAIEKMLFDEFNWHPAGYNEWGEWQEETFADNPLVILHISDHDFDGESIIGPTFAEQARRYTSNIIEARVGIKPEQVDNPAEHWYIVKTNNNGQINWAEEKALFMAQCNDCDHEFVVVGVKGHTCPECGGDDIGGEGIAMDPLNAPQHTAHGFEVEALQTGQYYRLIVDALLEALPYDFIVERLRDDCKADAWEAARDASKILARRNDRFQELEDRIQELEGIRDEFLYDIEQGLEGTARDLTSNWRNDPWIAERRDEDGFLLEPAVQDPPVDRLYRHVESGYGAWRPFKREDRTRKLITHLVEDEDNQAWAADQELDW